MYKIVGVIMVFVSLGGMLYKKGRDMDEKYNNLKEMVKVFKYLKQELSFASKELYRLCSYVASKTEGVISEIFSEISKKLEGNSQEFSVVWKEVAEGKELFLAEADEAILDFVNNFGKKSLDIEIENIERTKEILEELEASQREKNIKDKKMLYTLGASAGIALVILFI